MDCEGHREEDRCLFACLFVCNTATRLLVEALGLQAVALCTHEHNEASQQEAEQYT